MSNKDKKQDRQRMGDVASALGVVGASPALIELMLAVERTCNDPSNPLVVELLRVKARAVCEEGGEPTVRAMERVRDGYGRVADTLHEVIGDFTSDDGGVVFFGLDSQSEVGVGETVTVSASPQGVTAQRLVVSENTGESFTLLGAFVGCQPVCSSEEGVSMKEFIQSDHDDVGARHFRGVVCGPGDEFSLVVRNDGPAPVRFVATVVGERGVGGDSEAPV